MNAAINTVKRELCQGCRKSRLECFRFPCEYFMAVFGHNIREPEVFKRAQQWCAEGGFDLYVDDHRNWPIARPRFAVGDGVNYSFNGDAYPGTVIEVTQGESRVVIRRDRAVRGLYVVDPNGEIMVFTRRRDGAYRSRGHGTWTLDLGRESERNPHL